MNTQDARQARENLSNSAIGGKAITPGTALGLDTSAIYVGVAGNLVVTMADGANVTLSNVPVGFYPLSISMVVTSGTTAANPLGSLESGVWQLADTPNLSPGTYTFTVQAVTASGLNSPPSNEVTGSVLPNTIQKFQIIIDLKGTVTLTPQ